MPTGEGAYRDFQGVANRTMATSQPWWPARVAAPEGAPNVVLVIADDMGFSDLGCYGSEIDTPNLDALAARGLRYANFHVWPLCSPTRASLMTGLNAHAAGMGMVAHIDPGFPGYSGELPEDQPTVAEILRANGYATLAIGKWHLCKDSDMSEGGSTHSWPVQRGFDQYYGFLEALTNFHHPHRMYEGNNVVHTDRYPDGYYLTDDLTDRAVRMMREVKGARPDKPLFLYFAHGAVHAPLHAKPADIAKYRGRYDRGWDVLREERLARQIALGLMPEGTRLPPRNSEAGEDVVAWDSLDERTQTLYARYMEVYAAMVDSIDQSVGRLVATLEELGELDNTIFIFTSDNGASREGRDHGTTAYFRFSGIAPGKNEPQAFDFEHMDEIGGPTSWPHYPRGWAMACNTPFRLYKLTTYRGGNQVPFVLSWPSRLDGAGQVVRRQYVHVTDLLPTILDLAGIEHPGERHGRPSQPLQGATFAPTLTDPEAPSAHTEQYYEVSGHRGYYRDGWEAVTFHRPLTPFSGDHWELFDMEADPTQVDDLSAAQPERVRELVEAWERAAHDNQVFPLIDGTRLEAFWRNSFDARYTTPVRIGAGTPTLERWRSSRLIAGRSFRIEVDWDYTAGDEGIVLAHGGQESGYVLYVEGGELHFFSNEYGEGRSLGGVPLGAASSSVVVDVTAPGKREWIVSLVVDGVERAQGGGFVQPIGMLPYEGIDVGLDRRSPVCWDLYERHGTFPFAGIIRAVTYRPGELAPDAAPNLIQDALELGLGLE